MSRRLSTHDDALQSDFEEPTFLLEKGWARCTPPRCCVGKVVLAPFLLGLQLLFLHRCECSAAYRIFMLGKLKAKIKNEVMATFTDESFSYSIQVVSSWVPFTAMQAWPVSGKIKNLWRRLTGRSCVHLILAEQKVVVHLKLSKSELGKDKWQEDREQNEYLWTGRMTEVREQYEFFWTETTDRSPWAIQVLYLRTATNYRSPWAIWVPLDRDKWQKYVSNTSSTYGRRQMIEVHEQ